MRADKTTDVSGPSRADQRRQAAERRAELAPLKKAVQAAEKRMETLAAEIAKRDAALADPALYEKDTARAQKLSMERGQLAKDLAAAEEVWLDASSAYEAAEAGS